MGPAGYNDEFVHGQNELHPTLYRTSMAAPNRAALIGKIHKVLRKYFKPVASAERPVFEQLLFASCLENSSFESADEAFARLQANYFDWNEVRVTTVKELAEVMHMLSSPLEAAERLKQLLQSVFEATYSFELETLKKQNLGQAIQRLQKLKGASPFAVAYVVQNSLGGHAIPLDRGAMQVLAITGVIGPRETDPDKVTGLERAVPKTKGVEFASLLHQLAVDLVNSPFSPNVHKILLEIAPDAKDRLPKRQSKKKAEAPPETRPAKGREKPSALPKKAALQKKGAAAKSGTKPGAAAAAKKKTGRALSKPKPR
jgi:endonuclease-3